MTTPSSISRDKTGTIGRDDATNCSSILGKRERDDVDAPNQPRKRPATQIPPLSISPSLAERSEQEASNVSSPISALGSAVDDPEGVESDSKPGSTKDTFTAL